jgi:hypothetical protein
VVRSDGSPFNGLYAAGEAAGFGGGGVHGYDALEGTFLGGCIFLWPCRGSGHCRRASIVMAMPGAPSTSRGSLGLASAARLTS